MTDVKTKSLWRVINVHWVDKDSELDVIAVVLQGNGTEYVVTCVGPKGMNSNDFISAFRAAAAALIRTAGGDMAVVGASEPNVSQFDTGDQRAN